MSLSVDQQAIRNVSLALIAKVMEMKTAIISRSRGPQEPDPELRQFHDTIQQHENTCPDWATVKGVLLAQGFLGLLAVRRIRDSLGGQLPLALDAYRRARHYKNECFEMAAVRGVGVDQDVALDWLEEMDKHELAMVLLQKQLDLLTELD